MFIEPSFYVWVVVSAVVIDYQMQHFAFRKLAVQATQELEKFLVTMTFITFADNRTIEYIERGE